MWLTDAAAMKADFDLVFQRAYDRTKGSGELANLAELFTDAALKSYREALLRGIDPASRAWADIAWIDKRPIAKLKADSPGAELGDMMLVVNHFDPAGHVSSRACILEVKQSPSMVIPPVPVTSGKSTTNQFAILSEWPRIVELKATGKNFHPLLRNVVTRDSPTRDVLAQAWYTAVCPKGSQKQPWMVAPAIKDAEFSQTLGALFTACCRSESLHLPDIGPVGVGREFTPNSTLNSPADWSALVNTILDVAGSYDLPPAYFGQGAGSRRRSTWSSLPALAPVGFASGFWNSNLLNFGLGCFTTILLIGVLALQGSALMAPPRYWLRRRRRNAFPILTLTIAHSETFDLPRDRPLD